MASLLTSDYGDLDRVAIEVRECKRMGIKVLPPNVNYSFPEFGVSKNNEIYFALSAIKNVGDNVAQAIAEERKQNGQYKSLEDFLTRLPQGVINKKSLESLIKAGALDDFGDRIFCLILWISFWILILKSTMKQIISSLVCLLQKLLIKLLL